MSISVEDYNHEVTCVYNEEQYSVRDNGAVLRHAPINKRKRPTDNKWTFGKINIRTGYLEIASIRIHRIIATAFHGKPHTKEYVVDHIDTNRQNNRPDNLRWVTRLENILLNPITAKRIEIICGSIEEFLADPSKFRNNFHETKFEWMCTVSIEEAQASKERLLAWAESEKPLHGGSIGKWIFSRPITNRPSENPPNYIMSKTTNAAQRIVFTMEDKPNEYPSTPQVFEGDPLTAYYKNLTEGVLFFRNHNGEYVVVKSRLSKDRHSLYVLTKANYVYKEQENGEWNPIPIIELQEKVSDKDLPHSLAEITYENGLFLHEKIECGFHPTEELEELFTYYTQE